jgi:hypothetical protein
LTVGKNVAQRAVIRRKHLLREPHPMPVSHTNLSLNQAHCLRENAPQVCELPVFFDAISKALPLPNEFPRAWPSGTIVPQ